jgi:hypothetical protein
MGKKEPLALARCGTCSLVQLTHTVDPDVMYKGKYWYRSGVNESMRKALADVVEAACAMVKVEEGDVWIDIGANDGTLIDFIPEEFWVRAFDPAFPKPDKGCLPFDWYQDYFSAEKYLSSWGTIDVLSPKAKVISSIAMFYDLENPGEFVEGIKRVLHPEGVWVIQMAYLRTMLATNGFDNICHEHLEYYDLTSLEYLLNKYDLQVQDVTFNDVNGGSFRVFVTHKGRPLEKVQKGRIFRTFEKEDEDVLDEALDRFSARVKINREKTIDFIEQRLSQGDQFWVYGASTKGNTILQYYGLDSNHIAGAVERSPEKWGLLTVGTGIPIISETAFRNLVTPKRTHLFVLPWHFLDNFLKREADYLDTGGKFLVPLPYPVVISHRMTQYTMHL